MSGKMMGPGRPIRLIGLDLDGTVFDDQKRISARNRKAVERAIGMGVAVAPATGRPLIGVPEELTSIPGVRYAVTANGAAIYDMETGRRLYEDCLGVEEACGLARALGEYDVMVDAFVDGMGYVESRAMEREGEYAMSEVIRAYVRRTRKTVPDLLAFLRENGRPVEKITVNFKAGRAERGEPPLLFREEVLARIRKWPGVTCVSGVPTNLEITTATANKGNGMRHLGEVLGIPPEAIMACGDSGNDREMLLAVGFGVAMANSTEEVKDAADWVTLSNEEDGVAEAIERFVLSGQGA